MNINVHFGYDMANIQMPLDPNNGLQVVAYNHVELLDKPRYDPKLTIWVSWLAW